MQIIANVRKSYTGTVAYNANWGDEGNVGFWSSVDVIGVDAYYPLDPSSSTPALVDLINAWAPYITSLSALATKYGVETFH